MTPPAATASWRPLRLLRRLEQLLQAAISALVSRPASRTWKFRPPLHDVVARARMPTGCDAVLEAKAVAIGCMAASQAQRSSFRSLGLPGRAGELSERPSLFNCTCMQCTGCGPVNQIGGSLAPLCHDASLAWGQKIWSCYRVAAKPHIFSAFSSESLEQPPSTRSAQRSAQPVRSRAAAVERRVAVSCRRLSQSLGVSCSQARPQSDAELLFGLTPRSDSTPTGPTHGAEALTQAWSTEARKAVERRPHLYPSLHHHASSSPADRAPERLWRQPWHSAAGRRHRLRQGWAVSCRFWRGRRRRRRCPAAAAAKFSRVGTVLRPQPPVCSSFFCRHGEEGAEGPAGGPGTRDPAAAG